MENTIKFGGDADEELSIIIQQLKLKHEKNIKVINPLDKLVIEFYENNIIDDDFNKFEVVWVEYTKKGKVFTFKPRKLEETEPPEDIIVVAEFNTFAEGFRSVEFYQTTLKIK